MADYFRMTSRTGKRDSGWFMQDGDELVMIANIDNVRWNARMAPFNSARANLNRSFDIEKADAPEAVVLVLNPPVEVQEVKDSISPGNPSQPEVTTADTPPTEIDSGGHEMDAPQNAPTEERTAADTPQPITRTFKLQRPEGIEIVVTVTANTEEELEQALRIRAAELSLTEEQTNALIKELKEKT